MFRRRRAPVDPQNVARAAALDRAIAAWQDGEEVADAQAGLSAAQALAAASDVAPDAPHEPLVTLRAAIAARARRFNWGWFGRPVVRRVLPATALAAVVALAIAVPQLDDARENRDSDVAVIVELVDEANERFEQAAGAPDDAARDALLAQASQLVAQAQAQAAHLPADPRARIVDSLLTKIGLLEQRVADLETQLAAASTTTSTSSSTTSTTTSTTTTTRPSATTTTTSAPPTTSTTTPGRTTTTRPATTTTTEPSVDNAPLAARRP